MITFRACSLIFIAVFIDLLIVPGAIYGEEVKRREYIIKASFILKFPAFIEWPTKKSSFNVCVLADDPNIGIWENMEREKENFSPFSLIPLRGFSNYTECNILFVSGQKDDLMEKLISLTSGNPVLLIGDFPGYLEKGVGINFLIKSNRVRFEINRDSLKKNHLEISSELLNLAYRVLEDKQ